MVVGIVAAGPEKEHGPPFGPTVALRPKLWIGDDMEAVVAVKDPTAGPVRRPDHRHGGAGSQALGDRHALLLRPVDRVPGDVTPRVDSVVETVQVHGMCGKGRVDQPPADGVAHVVGEALGVRPGAAVDDQELAPEVGLSVFGHTVDPNAEHQDAVGWRAAARRVDDERAPELAVFVRPIVDGRAGGSPPVEVGPLHVRREARLPRFAGGDDQAVERGDSAGREPVDDEGAVQRIRDGDVHRGPQRDTDHGPGDLGLLSDLGERQDLAPGLIVSQEVPHALAHLELELENAVLERPGGVQVVVRGDLRRGIFAGWLEATGRESPRRNDQKQYDQAGWTVHRTSRSVTWAQAGRCRIMSRGVLATRTERRWRFSRSLQQWARGPRRLTSLLTYAPYTKPFDVGDDSWMQALNLARRGGYACRWLEAAP